MYPTCEEQEPSTTFKSKVNIMEKEPTDPPESGETPSSTNHQFSEHKSTLETETPVLPPIVKPPKKIIIPTFTIKRPLEPITRKTWLKRSLEETTDPTCKVQKPSQTSATSSEPNQSGTPALHTQRTNTASQTTDTTGVLKPSISLIHPTAYNTAIGCLMDERIKTILGPTQEPVVFEDDSSGTDEELESDQDVFIIADRACQVCFNKPPNVSLERHRRLGGFAITHKLGMLDIPKKHALAILTLAATLPNGLFICRNCQDFQVQLRDETKIPLQHIHHLMTHGSLLGDNPSVQDLLNKQIQGPLLCLQCTEVFPSFLSLMVHCGFSKDHSEKTEIYCNLCHGFFNRTTLISHHLQHHNNTLRCPMCDLGFVTTMDLLIHLMNSRPHYQLSQETLRLFTNQQIQELNKRRQPNTITTVRTELMVREALKIHNFIHLARYMNQPELFINFQAEIQNEPFQMPNLVELVARYLSKPDSLAVTELVRALRFGTKLANKFQDFKTYFYEINQINIGLFLKDLWNNATKLPTKLDELLYGVDVYAGPHLLGQSYLTHIPGKITTVDSKSYKAIVIGIQLLNNAGTLPNSAFPILNLSPDNSQENKWPTHFYTHFENTVQGIVHLEGKALHHLPSDKNYIQHVKEIALKAPLDIPICIELNLYSFLMCHSPETWSKLLKHSLKNILLGFFCGLTRVSQEVYQTRGKYPEFVVLGQPPVSSNFQINESVLIHLWYQVNIAAALVARFTKILFIPATGVIGLGPDWYSNILGKPHPTFTREQSLSSYTRTQALQVLQLYCRARAQTFEIFSP